MKWFTLKEKPPESGMTILIKSIKGIFPKYYVVNAYLYLDRTSKECWEFEEAGGEQYSCWEENEIEGWTSFSEIEKNEEWG